MPSAADLRHSEVEPTGKLRAEAYIRRHHLETYFCDMLGMQGRHTKGINPADNAVQYFEAVLKGQHVVGRSFEWIAATPHNRLCFLQRVHASCRGVEGPEDDLQLLTADDYLCVFRMLSPDFPSRVIKSGFKASVQSSPGCLEAGWSGILSHRPELLRSAMSCGILLDSGTSSQHQEIHGTDAEQARLTVPAFFQALHVVFLHETFLLTLRQLAFGGRSQSRRSVQEVLPHIKPAELACKEAGWCSLPAGSIEAACLDACGAGTGKGLVFDGMVRSLCSHRGSCPGYAGADRLCQASLDEK
ncbi:hypothetical protein WJX84_005402 [Apatococcus fuscideae]|uniref:Centriolar satellite-associated tubulin polyglutamylase complex regulator 1 n=1 Tax=Apatococcus fuscideae TaxID=2026836 RepID=A0AAW1SX83_9CHLO